MRNKHELYARQQHELIEKMMAILQLNENMQITLHKLDHDQDKKERIMNLIPQIRTWFAFGHIPGAFDPDKVKRPWLSLIKRIVGREYEIISEDHRIYDFEPAIRTKKYTFSKKD